MRRQAVKAAMSGLANELDAPIRFQSRNADAPGVPQCRCMQCAPESRFGKADALQRSRHDFTIVHQYGRTPFHKLVELRGELSMDDVCALLDNAGASSVRPKGKGERSIQETPQMWPSVGHASREDVQRSIDATKGGASLSTRRPGKT